MLVTKRDYAVHDPQANPGGGPLVTIKAGTPLHSIADRVLSQMHADHFRDVGGDLDADKAAKESAKRASLNGS